MLAVDRDAAMLAGYGDRGMPCEPRRSAYTEGSDGDVAFGRALASWEFYQRLVEHRAAVLCNDASD